MSLALRELRKEDLEFQASLSYNSKWRDTISKFTETSELGASIFWVNQQLGYREKKPRRKGGGRRGDVGVQGHGVWRR